MNQENPFPLDIHGGAVTHAVGGGIERTRFPVGNIQTGRVAMTEKLAALTRLLRKYIHRPSELLFNDGLDLAEQAHQMEPDLTDLILQAALPHELRKEIVRLPYRLKRVGEMPENILHCSRIMAQDGVRFTYEGYLELHRLTAILLHMMLNTQSALERADDRTLNRVFSEGERLDRRLADFRHVHWGRVEVGLCGYEASSTYLKILDSIGSAKGSLEKIGRTLREVGTPKWPLNSLPI